MQKNEIGVGLVGYGYWGPNLARNFAVQPGCRLVAVAEPNPVRAAQAALNHPQARMASGHRELLADPGIDAILIATPVSTHFEIARDALLAGKDVLVEKPITQTRQQAEELVRLARENGRILQVDHTFLFTGAVRKIKEIVSSGGLGEVLYIDSVRINLGLYQHDVNVLFDLAPHDLSIVNHLLDRDPVSVQALGSCHTCASLEDVVYLHLEYPGGVIAHVHLNWLAPVKIRKTIIAGTQKMIVYDDLDPSERVKVYDKGVVVTETPESFYKMKVDLRTGDMHAPKLEHGEALRTEAAHFLDCVRERTRPVSSGEDGLRVVSIIEAAQRSLAARGARVELGSLA